AAWRRIASSSRPTDIVHAHALSAAARLRIGDTPTVINLPGMADPRDIDDLRRADAIVADGYAAEHLPAALGRTVEHVPKGVDVDTFTPQGSNLRRTIGVEGKRVALVVSRLVPIKNVALAVDALAIAASECPALVLVIAGDGPLRGALDARIASLG